MCIRIRVRYCLLRAGSAASDSEAQADVAQLVEHHLAKVRVASSNLVVRSEMSLPLPMGEGLHRWWSGREARQRTANPCTRVQIPSPPRAVGAVGARFLDTEEVASSILASPTTRAPERGPFLLPSSACARDVLCLSCAGARPLRSEASCSFLPVPEGERPAPLSLLVAVATRSLRCLSRP